VVAVRCDFQLHCYSEETGDSRLKLADLADPANPIGTVVIAVLSFKTAVFVGILVYMCGRLAYKKCQSPMT
jgi:hypothetical protein